LKTDTEVSFIDYLIGKNIVELRGEVDDHIKDAHCSLAWWIRLYCAKFQKDFDLVLESFLHVATREILEYDIEVSGGKERVKVTTWHFGGSVQ
jgi:hypothetical protein